MTLEEVFSKAAAALDERDLKEYGDKIYTCADSVQREIAVFAAPIIRSTEVISDGGRILLPPDCYEVIGLWQGGGRISFINGGDGVLRAEDGAYTLKYHAYPARITAQSGFSHQLDISEEGAEAMVYGICAGLCINDEPELYSAYMNRYNGIIDAILMRKSRYPFAEITGGMAL